MTDCGYSETPRSFKSTDYLKRVQNKLFMDRVGGTRASLNHTSFFLLEVPFCIGTVFGYKSAAGMTSFCSPTLNLASL